MSFSGGLVGGWNDEPADGGADAHPDERGVPAQAVMPRPARASPALSAEEWERAVLRGICLEQGGFIRAMPGGALLWEFVDGYTVRATLLAGRDRRRVSAILLRGEPQGFHAEDVDLLLELAGAMRSSGAAGQPAGEGDERTACAERLRGLAGRIAALLPPSPERPA
jgi:hypothetical protein